MKNLEDFIDNIETMEIPEEMLELARQALIDLESRKDEDPVAWAARLAKSLVDADEMDTYNK